MKDKEDCLMYIDKLEKCNALKKTDCENCEFYKKATKQEKEKYTKEMKEKGFHILK